MSCYLVGSVLQKSQRGQSFMRQALLIAIRAYQRYISPHKGFCCAYRDHTGGPSCSAFGYRAVRRYGVFTGLALVGQRTYRCGVVHRRYRLQPVLAHHSQRGVCDVGCDLPCDGGCDGPGGGGFSKFFDFLSCCDIGSCDRSDRKRKPREDEKYVYIPPRATSRAEPIVQSSRDHR